MSASRSDPYLSLLALGVRDLDLERDAERPRGRDADRERECERLLTGVLDLDRAGEADLLRRLE